MIDETLLGLVLDKRVSNIKVEDNSNNMLSYVEHDNIDDSPTAKLINIYELAFKCKDWAMIYKFSISSCPCFENEQASATTKGKRSKNDWSYAETECEAIIKETEWVFDKVIKNKLLKKIPCDA